MCYNASLSQSALSLKNKYKAEIDPNLLKPIYFQSAFSLPSWPVMKAEDTGEFVFLKWGLIPYWEKNMESAKQIRLKTLNARFETLTERVSYRLPADKKRCAVVVDGYFEWKDISGKKYPYYLYMQEKTPFLLAGIWDRWVDKKTNIILETFSVVTTEAHGIAEEIHNKKKRMPFILDNDNLQVWMDTGSKFKEIKNKLVPSWRELKAHPVSKLPSFRLNGGNTPLVQKKLE